MTLFELKEKITTLNAAIKADADWIAEKAADPAVPMEEIQAKTAHRDELTERRDLLQKQHDEMEEQQRNAIALKDGSGNGSTEKDILIKNKAAFYRAVATKEGRKKAYEGLGALPAGSEDLGNGSALLPSTLSNELIAEPFEENSLRRVEQTSQIAGLEEPRISFSIDDEDLLEDVVDFETATEIETSADLVTYGRFKTKVKIEVADTVVYGSDANLVSTIENGLRSALARKEKLRAFAKSADDAHKHMSFYMKDIKGVTGTTVVAAIMAALGDLPDIFRANASVMMRSADWYTYIQTLANSSDTLFTAKPQDVLGVPVEFNDRAVIPIVGDFSYAKQNYEPVAVLDSDKDVDKGVFKYVLTAWGDHQIKLKSAFRLAITAEGVIGGIATANADKTRIKATPVYNTEADAITGTATYQWESLTAGSWASVEAESYSGSTTDEVTVVGASTDAGKSFRCKITLGATAAYTNVVKFPA